MSEHGHCPDCGGSNGNHFDDCTYEGTDVNAGHSRVGGSSVSSGKWWIIYIIALIIGYGINELLGVIIMLGLIVWLCVN